MSVLHLHSDSSGSALSLEYLNVHTTIFMLGATPVGDVHYFTDGLVHQYTRKAGCFHLAVVRRWWRISEGSFTLQVELVAICKALKQSRAKHNHCLMIHTDSRSSLQVLLHEAARERIS